MCLDSRDLARDRGSPGQPSPSRWATSSRGLPNSDAAYAPARGPRLGPPITAADAYTCGALSSHHGFAKATVLFKGDQCVLLGGGRFRGQPQDANGGGWPAPPIPGKDGGMQSALHGKLALVQT